MIFRLAPLSHAAGSSCSKLSLDHSAPVDHARARFGAELKNIVDKMPTNLPEHAARLARQIWRQNAPFKFAQIAPLINAFIYALNHTQCISEIPVLISFKLFIKNTSLGEIEYE